MPIVRLLSTTGQDHTTQMICFTTKSGSKSHLGHQSGTTHFPTVLGHTPLSCSSDWNLYQCLKMQGLCYLKKIFFNLCNRGVLSWHSHYSVCAGNWSQDPLQISTSVTAQTLCIGGSRTADTEGQLDFFFFIYISTHLPCSRKSKSLPSSSQIVLH